MPRGGPHKCDKTFCPCLWCAWVWFTDRCFCRWSAASGTMRAAWWREGRALVPRAQPRAWLHSEKGATKRSAGSNGAVKTGAICGRGKLRLGGTWETLWKKIVVTNTHWTMSPWEEEQANGAAVVCQWVLCVPQTTPGCALLKKMLKYRCRHETGRQY